MIHAFAQYFEILATVQYSTFVAFYDDLYNYEYVLLLITQRCFPEGTEKIIPIQESGSELSKQKLPKLKIPKLPKTSIPKMQSKLKRPIPAWMVRLYCSFFIR